MGSMNKQRHLDISFTETDFLVFVWNHYVDGLTVEEITVKARLFFYHDYNVEDMNKIIDELVQLF